MNLPAGTKVTIKSVSQSGTLTKPLRDGDTFARVSIPNGRSWVPPRLLLVPIDDLRIPGT